MTRYGEGDLFAVPLRDGGYGVGLAARTTGACSVSSTPRTTRTASRARPASPRPSSQDLPEDGLAGAGFVEQRMTRLLGSG